MTRFVTNNWDLRPAEFTDSREIPAKKRKKTNKQTTKKPGNWDSSAPIQTLAESFVTVGNCKLNVKEHRAIIIQNNQNGDHEQVKRNP